MAKSSLKSGGKYVSVHLRFEEVLLYLLRIRLSKYLLALREVNRCFYPSYY